MEEQVSIGQERVGDIRGRVDRNQSVTLMTISGGKISSDLPLYVAVEFRLSFHREVSVRLVVAGAISI